MKSIQPISNRTILTVAELNAEVNQHLTHGFPLLWVEGEISNLIRATSGHLYFSLKDSRSQIRCTMFRNRNMKLTIKPKNGLKVLIRGRVGLYEPRGDYQLIAEHMEDAGVGELQRQFEILKQKLASAGLFSKEHKKELPEYPKKIGIITSPTGAAIRDILHVLNRRSPNTSVLIYPVTVQGESAKIQIETAIRQANTNNSCDVLILTRGGGSIEDLWAFNEENTAKAIYHSNIPIICGVGHEIDFTIADFVADVRAPTPSAAAELITEDNKQLLTNIIQNRLWLQQKIKQEISQKRQKLDWLESRLNLQKPLNKIQQHIQRLDDYDTRLKQVIGQTIRNQYQDFENISLRLNSNKPSNRIREHEENLLHHIARLKQAVKGNIQQKKAQFKIQMATLDSVSPLKTLDRGYAIIKDKASQTLITETSQLAIHQKIEIQLKDDVIDAAIDS